MSSDTLRHYKRIGVLPRSQRTPSGYRVYSAAALDRVRLIRSALEVGFSLPELGRILRAREKGGVPCREVLKLVKGKLEKLESRLAELHGIRDHLAELIKD